MELNGWKSATNLPRNNPGHHFYNFTHTVWRGFVTIEPWGYQHGFVPSNCSQLLLFSLTPLTVIKTGRACVIVTAAWLQRLVFRRLDWLIAGKRSKWKQQSTIKCSWQRQLMRIIKASGPQQQTWAMFALMASLVKAQKLMLRQPSSAGALLQSFKKQKKRSLTEEGGE